MKKNVICVFCMSLGLLSSENPYDYSFDNTDRKFMSTVEEPDYDAPPQDPVTEYFFRQILKYLTAGTTKREENRKGLIIKDFYELIKIGSKASRKQFKKFAEGVNKYRESISTNLSIPDEDKHELARISLAAEIRADPEKDYDFDLEIIAKSGFPKREKSETYEEWRMRLPAYSYLIFALPDEILENLIEYGKSFSLEDQKKLKKDLENILREYSIFPVTEIQFQLTQLGTPAPITSPPLKPATVTTIHLEEIISDLKILIQHLNNLLLKL